MKLFNNSRVRSVFGKAVRRPQEGLSRRGLLGLIAAAPVAAAAAPMLAASEGGVRYLGIDGAGLIDCGIVEVPWVPSPIHPLTSWSIHDVPECKFYPGTESFAAGVTDDTRGERSGPLIQSNSNPSAGGNGLADGRSDARRSERGAPAAVRCPAAASDQTFDDNEARP